VCLCACVSARACKCECALVCVYKFCMCVYVFYLCVRARVCVRTSAQCFICSLVLSRVCISSNVGVRVLVCVCSV